MGTSVIPIVRALVLALAAGVLCWPFSVGSGVAAAVFATAAAALAAERVEAGGWMHWAGGRRLRLASVWLLALFVALLGTVLARWTVQGAWLAQAIGAIPAIWTSETLLWFFLLGPTVFALRVGARRHPALGVVELALVGAAFAVSLSAHRHGMVHRPLALGDWAWNRGFDPAYLFLLLGGLSTGLLALLFLSEERTRRIPIHLTPLALVALVLLLLVRFEALPQPDPPGAGDPEAGQRAEEKQGKGEGEGASGSRSDKDWEFEDLFDNGFDQAPVAVTLFHDDYSPTTGAYYFRQSALSQYNGKRLIQATRGDVDLDIVKFFPGERFEVPGAPEESESRVALRTTTGLLVDHVRPFALDSPGYFAPAHNAQTMRFQRVYDALSLVQVLPYDEMLGRQAGRADWGADQWAHYTEAPADPRYASTAREATKILHAARRDDPLAKALAVKLYHDERGVYSLRNRHAGAQDPTASFLFGDLTGYCVHFAHASAFLLRSLGVPTRVATGYMVPERHRYGGSAVLLRSLNAHAWPEIYLEDVGWVVVDLSPQQVRGQTAGATDPELQRNLAELLRQHARERDPFADGPLDDGIAVAAILRGVGWLLLATVLFGFGIKTYRALAPQLAPARHLYRVGYRASLDRLAEVGLRRGYGESREHFAARARHVAPSFGELTGEHLHTALGRRALEATPIERLRALYRGVRAERRARVPAWRRLLGAAHPFSWLRAR